MGALIALRLIFGIGGRNAEMAQAVVVTTGGDAGEMLLELEEGLGTAVARCGAWPGSFMRVSATAGSNDCAPPTSLL